jgi:hypothetical protein
MAVAMGYMTPPAPRADLFNELLTQATKQFTQTRKLQWINESMDQFHQATLARL